MRIVAGGGKTLSDAASAFNTGAENAITLCSLVLAKTPPITILRC